MGPLNFLFVDILLTIKYTSSIKVQISMFKLMAGSKVAALRRQGRLAASHNELQVPLQLRVLHRPLHVYKLLK